MSKNIKAKADRLLAQEQGTVRKDWGGRVAFALVYPNTYAVGMSNLGFQTIYRHLNAVPDVVCEGVLSNGLGRRTSGRPPARGALGPAGDDPWSLPPAPIRRRLRGGRDGGRRDATRECPGHRSQAPSGAGGRLPDDLTATHAQRGVRPSRSPRGREGMRPGLSVLPRRGNLPPGPAPEPRGPARDGAGAQEGVDAGRTGGGMRLGLPVDRRPGGDPRRRRPRGVDLVHPS